MSKQYLFIALLCFLCIVAVQSQDQTSTQNVQSSEQLSNLAQLVSNLNQNFEQRLASLQSTVERQSQENSNLISQIKSETQSLASSLQNLNKDLNNLKNSIETSSLQKSIEAMSNSFKQTQNELTSVTSKFVSVETHVAQLKDVVSKVSKSVEDATHVTGQHQKTVSQQLEQIVKRVSVNHIHEVWHSASTQAFIFFNWLGSKMPDSFVGITEASFAPIGHAFRTYSNYVTSPQLKQDFTQLQLQCTAQIKNVLTQAIKVAEKELSIPSAYASYVVYSLAVVVTFAAVTLLYLVILNLVKLVFKLFCCCGKSNNNKKKNKNKSKSTDMSETNNNNNNNNNNNSNNKNNNNNKKIESKNQHK